ncbi:MAG: FKBP-type peptidyl-prolyl cis-trans isomerase [Streptomycetaceae bacterium]|nr:FKBP-type peptidyl-prolyl cis-trans isomerase [Streptomycetaceae bacterium]
MRRLAALFLVPALMVGAAACGGDSGDKNPSPTSSSTKPARFVPVSTTGAVTANPAFGQAPDIKIPDVPAPAGLQVQVLTEGTGPAVTGVDNVKINYEGVAYSTKKVFDGTFETNQPAEFYLEGLIKGWSQGLTGKKIGSRVLMNIPAELGYGAAGQGDDIKSNETLVFVVDLISSTPGYATGKAMPQNPDLPTVQTDGAKVVNLTFPAGKNPPATLVSQVLIEGGGNPVAPTDQVTQQQVQWVWGGQMLGSSWGGLGPQAVALGGESTIMKAVTEGLAGKKVGSRVMLVIPPDRGFGATGSPTNNIPANATLVLVVDIVAAGPATGTGS